jgi:hypothetical protein
MAQVSPNPGVIPISNGFQHPFWQAIKLGTEMAIMDCNVKNPFGDSRA